MHNSYFQGKVRIPVWTLLTFKKVTIQSTAGEKG